MQADFGTLEHSSNRDGELIGARAALVDARTSGLALQLVVAVNRAAVGADNAVGPAQGFEVLAGLVRVLELRLIED
jgi:hypothetical protein